MFDSFFWQALWPHPREGALFYFLSFIFTFTSRCSNFSQESYGCDNQCARTPPPPPPHSRGGLKSAVYDFVSECGTLAICTVFGPELEVNTRSLLTRSAGGAQEHVEMACRGMKAHKHSRFIVGRVLHHSGKDCKKKTNNPKTKGLFILTQVFTCFSDTCENSTGGMSYCSYCFT